MTLSWRYCWFAALAAILAGGASAAEVRFPKPVRKVPPPPVHYPVYDQFAHRARIIEVYAKEVEELKESLDQWGSIAFAPPLFAPAEEPGRAPFELRGDSFTLNGLYADYNEANGRSLFSQRTLSQLYGAYGMGMNTTAQAVEQARADIFSANVDRNIARGTEVTRDLEFRYETALVEANAAQAALDKANADLAAKTEAKAKTAAELVYAQSVKNAAVSDADKNEAERALLAAQANDAKAKELLDAAVARQGAADTARTEANQKRDTLAGELRTAYDTEIAIPTTLPENGLPIPLAGSPVLGTAGGTVSPLAAAGNPPSPGLGGMGSAILPTLLSNTNPAMFSPMARINSASSALMVKNLLSFLGKPEAAAVFEDKRLLFAVSSVSVNPGWRTTEGYTGLIDGDIRTELAPASMETIQEVLKDPIYPVRLRALIAQQYPQAQTVEQRVFFSKVGNPYNLTECIEWQAGMSQNSYEPKNIVVHAVTPMVDSQNLDLASSIARQDEIALYLAASLTQAGSSQAGKVFKSWSRSRRKDIATRSTIAVANSFSMAGHFGFEIGTRLRALNEDAAKGNKAAQVLDRQTFPVLMILGMEEDDARPKLSFERAGGGVKVRIEEPLFLMDYSARWIRNNHGFFSFFGKDRKPSAGYEEIMEEGRAESEMKFQLCRASRQAAGRFADAEVAVLDNLEREGEGILKALHGTGYRLPLPPRWLLNRRGDDDGLYDADLRVQKVEFEPPALSFTAVNEKQTVRITGENLRVLNPSAITLTGEGLSLVAGSSRYLGDDAIAVEVQVTREGAGVARLVLPYRAGAVSAPEAAALPLTDGVVTPELPFTVGATSRPVMENWLQPALELGDLPQQNVWKADVELVLQGKNLDRVDLAPDPQDPEKGKVWAKFAHSPELKEVVFQPKGGSAAVVKLEIESPASKGSLYIVGQVKGAAGVSVVSPPVTFTFTQKKMPVLEPWLVQVAVGSGKEEAATSSEAARTAAAAAEGTAEAAGGASRAAQAAGDAAKAAADASKNAGDAAKGVADAAKGAADAAKGVAAAAKGASGAAAQADKPKTWSGEVQVLVQGQALDRLGEPTVSGVTGTATFVPDSSSVGMLVLKVSKVPKGEGVAYVRFVVQDDPSKPKVFAQALPFKLIK